MWRKCYTHPTSLFIFKWEWVGARCVFVFHVPNGCFFIKSGWEGGEVNICFPFFQRQFFIYEYCFQFLQIVIRHSDIGKESTPIPLLYQCKPGWEGARCVFVFHSPNGWLTFSEYCFHFVISHCRIERKWYTLPTPCWNVHQDQSGERCVFVFHSHNGFFVILLSIVFNNTKNISCGFFYNVSQFYVRKRRFYFFKMLSAKTQTHKATSTHPMYSLTFEQSEWKSKKKSAIRAQKRFD